MSKRRITVGASAAGVLAAAAITAGAIAPANADLAPRKNDVVGVGSDAVQNAIDFLADGVTLNGKKYPGYNATAKKFLLDDIDASGDANGGTTPNATVTLQAGTSPVRRPDGGGAGVAALIADGASGKDNDLIDFARSTTPLTAAQETQAQANLGTYLDWVTLATDTDYIATTTASHAPSVLTPADVLAIYTGKVKTWSDLATFRQTEAGASSLSPWTPDPSWAGDTIIAFYPQNGAGMQTVFLNGLTAANGGTKVGTTNLGSNALQVKQNDPTTLLDPSKAINPSTGASYGFAADQAADVIVPIPQSKYNLFQAGYYQDGSKVYSAAPGSQSTIGNTGWKLQTSAGSFSQQYEFDIFFRAKDLTAKAAWQPGSKLNWVQTLFYNTSQYANPSYKPTKKQAKKHPKVATPFAFSPKGQAILKALGLTPQPYSLKTQANTVG